VNFFPVRALNSLSTRGKKGVDGLCFFLHGAKIRNKKTTRLMGGLSYFILKNNYFGHILKTTSPGVGGGPGRPPLATTSPSKKIVKMCSASKLPGV